MSCLVVWWAVRGSAPFLVQVSFLGDLGQVSVVCFCTPCVVFLFLVLRLAACARAVLVRLIEVSFLSDLVYVAVAPAGDA